MKNFVKLGLENEFNHKCILESRDLMRDTGLDNQGLPGFDHFFVSSSCPKSGELIEVDGIPFAFPDKSINKYDNIECCEQEIKIPSFKYAKIHVLGFSVYQNCSEKFKLMSDNGEQEEVDLSFMDWYNVESKQEGTFNFDTEMLEQHCILAYKALNTDEREVGFYHTSSYIDQNNKLSKIIMPFDFNVHILAITLEV